MFKIVQNDETSRHVLDASETTSSDLGCTSTRKIESKTSIHQKNVHRILRNILELFPYQLSRQQHLQPSDFDARFEYANRMLDEIHQISNILFNDECHFYWDGDINPKNCIIWNSTKPNVIVTKPLHSEKVTVRMGVSKDFITLFFPWLSRWQNLSENVGRTLTPRVTTLQQSSLMQDGAPPHIATPVKPFLQHHFGSQRIISRYFPQPWPARSPDLNPCDF